MIKLVTGTIGSGKTLYEIKNLRRYIEEYDKVYTNIDGLQPFFFWSEVAYKVQPLGCALFATDQLIEHILSVRDDENRGNVLYLIDEASFYFPNSRAPFFHKEFLDFLAYSRHYSIDFVLICQSCAQIHYSLRHLVTEHIHIRRRFGTGLQTILKKEGVLYEVNNNFILKRQVAAGDICMERSFLDKRYFDAYSTSVLPKYREAKKELPFRLVLALCFLGVLPFVFFLPLKYLLKF